MPATDQPPQCKRGMTRSANTRIERVTGSFGMWPPGFIQPEKLLDRLIEILGFSREDR